MLFIMKKVQLKEVLLTVVAGNREVVSQLVSYEDKWVVENVDGKTKRYLKRNTYYTVTGLDKFYRNCLENFTKLTKMEIESLFQIGLNEFIFKVISESNPHKVEKLPESALINWAKKHIKGYILHEMDKVFGKVKFDKSGQIVEKEIEILSEAIATGDYYGEDEDNIDGNSLYNDAAFELWERKNTYISFADFIKDMKIEEQIRELLSKTELTVYPKLITKYQVDNQKEYGNSHIADEIGVSESRVRQIEEKIGDKLFKLYKLWINTRKRKDTPLSHEIIDFLEMFTHVINSVDDENLQFEMLIGWFKTQIAKEKQVTMECLHKNKVDESKSIIDLICDNDTGLSEVLLTLDKQLHKSTYMTLYGLLEGSIDSSTIRKESKRTIITKCLDIFYTYLNQQDKDIKRIVKYNNTYQETKRNNEHINKGHIADKYFNEKVSLIS
jgi:hypothetical protein